MNRIIGVATNVVFHLVGESLKPVSEIVLTCAETEYTLSDDTLIPKEKINTIRVVGIGAENVRSFGEALIADSARIEALMSIERGSAVLAGENKVLRDLLGEAQSVIETIDGETSEERRLIATLVGQIEAARIGNSQD